MNKELIKQLIPLADAHAKADEYLAGIYWNTSEAKGCSIGCTIHDAQRIGAMNAAVARGDHESLAIATGFDFDIWLLADAIFEGMDKQDRRVFTPRYLRAMTHCSAPDTVVERVAKKSVEMIVGQEDTHLYKPSLHGIDMALEQALDGAVREDADGIEIMLQDHWRHIGDIFCEELAK
jgi:hypothetical protein